MARPTLCTRELAEEIAGYIREVGFVGVAVAKAGIGERTHYEWMERGENDLANGDETSPFAVYAQAIKKARADFQYEQTQAVREGRQGWQSRAWMLERSDPEQFAVRQRLEHSGRVETGAAPVLSPAEWEARKRQILGGEEVH